MLEVNQHGQLATNGGKPVEVAKINKTWDGVDMQWEKDGPTMIGVGPRGYYAMGYNERGLTCVPVKVKGDGLTPGNFLHAFMATAYPNPAESRYELRANAIRPAAADTRLTLQKD